MKKISQYSFRLGKRFGWGKQRSEQGRTDNHASGSTSADSSFFVCRKNQTSSQAAVNDLSVQPSKRRADSELIASLLDDDDFLSSILAALVDDGLHECRRVCRKWRDACDALQLKLALMDRSEVQHMTEKFPNASDLSITAFLPVNSYGRQPPLFSSRDQFLGTWFDSLAKLPCLKRLLIETVHFTDFLCEDLEPLFQPLVQLRSLSIRSLDDHHIDAFFFAVRVLTNLTSLQLTTDKQGVQSLNANPVTELQRLKELEIAEHLSFNKVGGFMFPGATQLTHLSFWYPSHGRSWTDRFKPALLETVCEFYGSSLRSLRLCRLVENDADSAVRSAWSVLLQFPELQSLVIDYLDNRTGAVESVIGEMLNLTSLRLNSVSSRHENASTMLTSLSGLKSLCYLPSSGSTPSSLNAPGLEIRRLTQLTALTTVLYSHSIPFHDLTGLVELDIQLTVGLDLSDTVRRLTALESLKLLNRRHACLKRPSVLRYLTRLKALTLDMPNDVTGDFFPALGSLSDLTFLQFNCQSDENIVTFLSQISLVTNLKKLSVEHMVVAHPLQFLHCESLPRLRSLNIQSLPDRARINAELRRRLPCLSKISP